MTVTELLNKLAEVEHNQWIEWSQSVAGEVSEERRNRWAKLWVPYDELPESEKDKDRVYAMRSMQYIQQFVDSFLTQIEAATNEAVKKQVKKNGKKST